MEVIHFCSIIAICKHIPAGDHLTVAEPDIRVFLEKNQHTVEDTRLPKLTRADHIRLVSFVADTRPPLIHQRHILGPIRREVILHPHVREMDSVEEITPSEDDQNKTVEAVEINDEDDRKTLTTHSLFMNQLNLLKLRNMNQKIHLGVLVYQNNL